MWHLGSRQRVAGAQSGQADPVSAASYLGSFGEALSGPPCARLECSGYIPASPEIVKDVTDGESSNFVTMASLDCAPQLRALVFTTLGRCPLLTK